MKTWSGPLLINVTVYEPFSNYSAQYFTSSTVPRVRLCSDYSGGHVASNIFSLSRSVTVIRTQTYRKCLMRGSHQTTVSPYCRWSVPVCTLLIAESLRKYLMKSSSSERIFCFLFSHLFISWNTPIAPSAVQYDDLCKRNVRLRPDDSVNISHHWRQYKSLRRPVR